MNKKIAYVTDIHLDETFPIEQGVDCRKNWQTILDDISSREINEIIFGGDIGERAANMWFFDSLSEYTIYISLGNHDYFDEVIKHNTFGIDEKQSELFYSRDRGKYKMIFLDSSAGLISPNQLGWFKNQLSTKKDIVLFVHHPILAVDVQVDKQFALQNRNLLKTELLKIENNITIFCGHYHLDDVARDANILQYSTPASSYQVEKIPNLIKVNNETFGYRIIDFTEKGIDTDLITFNKI